MEGQDRPSARQLLLQRDGPALFAAGDDEHLPLPWLDGGGDRDRHRHRRPGQRGARAAHCQVHHRPVPRASGHRPRPVGLRIPQPAHVPRHACVGPQGRGHGGDLGGGPRHLGHPRQVGEQAGVQAARRAHEGEDPLLLLQALPHGPEADAGRGRDLPQPGLQGLQDALRLRAGARAARRRGELEVGGSGARGDRLRQRPDARVLHGLEPGVRQAHLPQAGEVPATLARGAGDRRRHRWLCRVEPAHQHPDLRRRA